MRRRLELDPESGVLTLGAQADGWGSREIKMYLESNELRFKTAAQKGGKRTG